MSMLKELRRIFTPKVIAVLYTSVVLVAAVIVWQRLGILRALALVGAATLAAIAALVLFYGGYILLWLAAFGLEELLVRIINFLLREYADAGSLDEVPSHRRAVTKRLSGLRRRVWRWRIKWLEPNREIVK